jgi:hypothetical protein
MTGLDLTLKITGADGRESTEHRTVEIPDHRDADALHRVFHVFALGIDSGPTAGYPDAICLPDCSDGIGDRSSYPCSPLWPHSPGRVRGKRTGTKIFSLFFLLDVP